MSFLSKKKQNNANEVITIVSGLPRSGTSMLMKMIETGGMETLVDNIRKADDNNPKGYYEFERVKKIEQDNAWLPDARGKAIKIISKLLIHLPPVFSYKVIFLNREMKELLASQRKMLISRGVFTDDISEEEMAEIYEKHLIQTQKWLRKNAHFEVMYIGYNSVIEKPLECSQQINDFLGRRLNTNKMAEVIDGTLYRHRHLNTGRVGILGNPMIA